MLAEDCLTSKSRAMLRNQAWENQEQGVDTGLIETQQGPCRWRSGSGQRQAPEVPSKQLALPDRCAKSGPNPRTVHWNRAREWVGHPRSKTRLTRPRGASQESSRPSPGTARDSRQGPHCRQPRQQMPRRSLSWGRLCPMQEASIRNIGPSLLH